MNHRMTHLLAIGAVTAAMACTSQPAVTTTNRPTTTTTSSGDVALSNSGNMNGMWMDSTGGTWMDNTGGLWMGGRNGTAIGLQAGDVSALTNANIVAHLAAGDSLEVALSQAGADRAQNQAVRDFARRMVTEHSAHMQMGRQVAMQGGITPAPSPADTTDAMLAARMMNRLSNAPAGADYDRRLMQAEVMMHQHMLRELQMVQPQATGAARQLVDQTIPVVQQHLTDAQSLWRQVGGGMNNGMDGMNHGSNAGTSNPGTSTPSSSTPSSSTPSTSTPGSSNP
jgi:putative membrane protein